MKGSGRFSPSSNGQPAGIRGVYARLYGQRRRSATIAAAALALAVGYHVIFGQNGLTAYEKKREDERVLTQQAQRLAEDNAHLQGHVSRLQSDPGAIEHQAREELHYTRPGEVIVTLPNEKPASESHSSLPASSNP